MGRVRAYRSVVRTALTTLLLLASAAVAPAQTNPAAPEVAPPIRYNRYIQLHQVPVDIKSPAQLRREEERGTADRGLAIPEPALKALEAPPEAFPTPPPNRAPPRRASPDDRWDKRLDTDRDKDRKKDPKASWGWLADDVREAGERRQAARSEEPDAEEQPAEPEREGDSSSSNQSARTTGPWAERRDTATRGEARAQPLAGAREVPSRAERDPRGRPDDWAGSSDDTRARNEPTPATYERPPDWMLTSAAAVPDTPIGRSLLGQQPDAGSRSPATPASDWLLRPGTDAAALTPFNMAGGLRPLEPAISAPTRMGSGLGEPLAVFQPDAGRGDAGGSALRFGSDAGAASGSALGESWRPAPGLPRPSLGSEPGTPGIQTRTLPW